MSSIFCEVSKYLMIIFFALYTWECFSVFNRKSKDRQNAIFRRQNLFLFLLHLDGYLVLFDQTDNPKIPDFLRRAGSVLFDCDQQL